MVYRYKLKRSIHWKSNTALAEKTQNGLATPAVRATQWDIRCRTEQPFHRIACAGPALSSEAYDSFEARRIVRFDREGCCFTLSRSDIGAYLQRSGWPVSIPLYAVCVLPALWFNMSRHSQPYAPSIARARLAQRSFDQGPPPLTTRFFERERHSYQETPEGSAISQNGQSSERRCRAGRFRVLSGFCAILCPGFPIRNRCGTVKTKLFSAA